MPSFDWDQNFVTGIPSVDKQHQSLVDLINEFGDLLSQNRVQMEDIDRVFKHLADYAGHHFHEEEELMTRVGVDPRHRDAHVGEHRKFMQETTEMYARVEDGNSHAARELLDFLSHWLAYHILGEDQNMARQIAAISAGTDPASAFADGERKTESSTEPLLRALKGLFAMVSARNEELLHLNQSLEDKVSNRTRALSDLNRRLEELSLTDVLTGLPNRRHAMQQLAMLWEESVAKDSPLVCMMIDADHFKEINDLYGHDVGDKVLRQLALTLQHAIRNDDFVSRLGGDEFFVICPATSEQGGMQVGEAIRRVVSELRVDTGGEPWCGSVSIGVACRKPGMLSHEELIKAADQGVYLAKKAGKNCVRAPADN